GPQPSGAIYRICMPATWNGDLLVWAHGYVDPQEPVGIPEGQLTLPDGTSIIDIATSLNYAFATTSYRDNGLVVPLAVDDIAELVGIFEAAHGPAQNTFLAGASEGGLITTLALEQHRDIFDGGIGVCGPIGDFGFQVNHFGDFRVVFDYYFPGVIPSNGVMIPQEVIDNWDAVYVPAIKAAIAADLYATSQVLRVTGVPFDVTDPSTIEETFLGLLWYNTHATNDGIAKLGGNPFGNGERWYTGSDDDLALNLGVQRFNADPAALASIAAEYQTTGVLDSPLITMHTTGDPIVPALHGDIYTLKALIGGSFLKHLHVPIERYGHCSFTPVEAVFAFLLMGLLVVING
ncbi:MAG TPA: hypothetical protein VIW01_07895, partial [Dehalococcoidia bacterium]